jgi:hypothetical protein
MRRALVLLAAAVAAISAGGYVIGRIMHLPYGHGLYCAIGVASTEGCDVAPRNQAARLVLAGVIVVCIPLFTAAYSSIMSAHLRKHMDLHRRATVAQIRHDLDDVKAHTRKTVNGAATSLHRRLDDHEDLMRAMAAGGLATSQGLSAEETGPPPAADPPLGGERVVRPASPAGGM